MVKTRVIKYLLALACFILAIVRLYQGSQCKDSTAVLEAISGLYHYVSGFGCLIIGILLKGNADGNTN